MARYRGRHLAKARPPKDPPVVGWTLVQHSGYVRGGNGQFRSGVEIHSIRTLKQKDVIRARGGFVFETYSGATTAEMAENYPRPGGGLIPCVRGQFDERIELDGLPLYIPRKEEPRG